MKKLLIYTHMGSVEYHWQESLQDLYIIKHFDKKVDLFKYLDEYNESNIVMIDETNVHDIKSLIDTLKSYDGVKSVIFNTIPEVYHASTLLITGIKGYENTFIAKPNLRKMIQNIQNGKNWFFEELAYYIINRYVQSNKNTEPEFMKKLTPKEQEIAIMIADGLSNKQIATREQNALSTIKNHIKHIFEKAEVKDRVSLAMKFR